MKYLIKIALIALALTLPLFANSVATLTALKGDVSIQNKEHKKVANLGDKLFEKDNVITGTKSKAQIIFKDETIVTVGKNSNFSIAKYLYEDTKKPELEFGLLKGAMNTISGKIGKIAPEKFKVKTKTATIGIRGTNFTVIVLEDGSQRVYCTYGAISVTIDGKVYEVQHGYYLNITASGIVSVQAFSSEELADMQKDNFGQKAALKGNASKESSLYGNGMIIDTTKERVSEEELVSLDDEVQDAFQRTLITQNTAELLLSGWSVDSQYIIGVTSHVKLAFVSDGSLFDATNSWVEALNVDNSVGQMDDWKFTLASTPSAFVSSDDFTIGFSSVELTPLSGSSSQNAVLSGGSLSATTDLANNDYMSWGTWNTEVTYEYLDGFYTPDLKNFDGLWVAGEETDASVVAALSGTYAYNGEYRVFNTMNPGTIESGAAQVTVDFGADTAGLILNSNGSLMSSTYFYTGMTVAGNGISGGSISYGTGSANGTFYGPDAKSIGGNFNITDGSTELQGVYQAVAP